MDKVEFNNCDIEMQVNIINDMMKLDSYSLRKSCLTLGLNKSTVQSRFKKAGYLLVDNIYLKSLVNCDVNTVNNSKNDLAVEKVQTVWNYSTSYSIFEYEEHIKKCINEIAVSFIQIGHDLSEIKQRKLYLEKGFASVFDYALKVLDIRESTVYNLINVYLRFGDTVGLKKEYKNFSYSKLTEMLNLPFEVIKDVKSSDTVKQIKDKKKKAKEKNDVVAVSSCSDPVTEFSVKLNKNKLYLILKLIDGFADHTEDYKDYLNLRSELYKFV